MATNRNSFSSFLITKFTTFSFYIKYFIFLIYIHIKIDLIKLKVYDSLPLGTSCKHILKITFLLRHLG